MIKICKIKKFRQINTGFTLIETLIAISIFTMSILGLFMVLSQGIADTNYAKRKIIAAYLTQEGIEYIRNMRDTFVLYSATSQTGWDAFNIYLTTNSCGTTNGCYFNADNLFSLAPPMPMTKITLAACSSSTCPNGALLYDSTTGKYGFAGMASGYTRKITMTTVSANETKIFSTVYWTQGSGNYSIIFSENLFNWIE
jgi:Tfp pilus assembly protein PilV